MVRLRRWMIGPALAVAFVAVGCGTPPDKEIQQAQGAIDAARAAGAAEYARDELTGAQDALAKAREAVAGRDYRQALNYALDSRERAQTAAKEAADNRATARTDADRALAAATEGLEDAQQQVKAAEAAHVPAKVLGDPKRQIATGTKSLQNLRAAFDAGNYPNVTQEARTMGVHFRDLARDLQTTAKAPSPKSVNRRGRRSR